VVSQPTTQVSATPPPCPSSHDLLPCSVLLLQILQLIRSIDRRTQPPHDCYSINRKHYPNIATTNPNAFNATTTANGKLSEQRKQSSGKIQRNR
jgi:hypothetical protein